MESPSGEKPDGLEIISIGALYRGSWDKKYWSSSRGKDRYPYPVGYHAVRIHIGSTYRMEIREGLKGPLFVITSTNGESCSGQTPDIAWERFQKNGGSRVKMWHGKRYSCKIDGVELFGFRNPFVQRLLRELVANGIGTAERSLLSPSFCNGASALKHETRSPDSCMYPDLLPFLAKPQITGKRSRTHKITTINTIGEAGLKRLRPQDLLSNAEGAIPRQQNCRLHHDKKCVTSCTSDEGCEIYIDLGALPVQVDRSTVLMGGNGPFSVNDGLPVDSLKFSYHLGEEAVFPQDTSKFIGPENNELSNEEKLLDRSLEADVGGGHSLQETEINNGEILILTESKAVDGLAVCAPDTLDILQDNIADSVLEESPCNVKDLLVSADTVVSERLVEENMGASTSNASSENSDFDSFGQELAKSMMTVLLPRAVPLLKKTSMQKRKTIRGLEISPTKCDPCSNLAGVKIQEENNGINHLANVVSPGKFADEIPIEDSCVEGEEKLHILGTYLGSDIPNSEELKSVAPDSFEDDQCGNRVTNQSPLCPDFVQADPEPFGKNVCNPDALRLVESAEGKPFLVCHIETGGSKELFGSVDVGKESIQIGTSGNKEILGCDKTPITPNEGLEKGETPTDSPLGCLSSDNHIFIEEVNEVCTNLVKSPLCVEIDSKGDGLTDKDIKIETDCTEGTSVLEPTFLMHKHAQSSHAENMFQAEIPISHPANEPPNTIIFQRKETALSPILASETSYREQEFLPSSSTKNLETVSGEILRTKVVQYHWGHCPTVPKYQRIHSDQDNFNGHKNEDNPNNHGLSATIDKRDAYLTSTSSSVHISQKEGGVKTGATRTSTASSFLHISNEATSTTKYRGPLSESIICRNVKDGCIPEAYPAIENLLATEIDQDGETNNSPTGKDSFVSEAKLGGHHGLHIEKTMDKPKGIFFDVASVESQTQVVGVHAAYNKDASCFLDPSVSYIEKYQAAAVNKLVGPHNLIECSGAKLWFQKEDVTFSHNNENEAELAGSDVHAHTKPISRDVRNLRSHGDVHQGNMLQDDCFTLETEPNNESKGFVELVGCYLLPSPVLSVFFSTKGDDITICVLCGLLVDMDRALFIYEVPIKEPMGGCPSFLAYTSIMLPILKDNFGRDIASERYGLQFTPNGQYLVFLNSIKAPCCRERRLNCLCSACTSESFEENAVKVVRVELGYVSVVAKLKTVHSVHCILVCEPSHLVAVEESGRLHVWIMNSTWSAQVEEFILQSFDCISPCVVELKRIPKCGSVIVGHNGFGDFGLWDISKRTFLSRFSAPSISIFQFLPVGFFSWQRNGPNLASADMEEHIRGIMAAMGAYFSRPGEDAFLPSNGEDIAIWLLVLAASSSEDQHEQQSNDCKANPDGWWRLAILVNNTVILGSALDTRASAADALFGHGIIGTRDGLVYMWELSTGAKLADLHHLKGGGVSFIAADSRSGVFAVASDECQLLVYVHTPQGILEFKG